MKTLGLPHGRGTPGRHTANGYCEQWIRRVVDGARCLLEHAGLPSCYWVFAIRYWCFAHNTEVVNGDSAWNRRHGQGQFPHQVLPFGCTVDFLDKPEKVKGLDKFETRASVGILVGYHLQPGGLWKNEWEVFRKEDFEDFDFRKPRTLNELRPVRTQEVAMTTHPPPIYAQGAI